MFSNTTPPDVNSILGGLKDFQRGTVDYVFKRLYEDDDAVSKFLIADEVGLGKTLVARGIIAKAVEKLWPSTERIDIIYICSNQNIAQQNIDRLNITQDRRFQHAARATLLPITVNQLQGSKLNFVSLTPGTSFRLASQTGVVWERVVLYHILKDIWDVPEKSLEVVLRADVYEDNWKNYYLHSINAKRIDRELKEEFVKRLEAIPKLRRRFDELSAEVSNNDDLTRWKRNEFIGNMRHLLAKTSLSSLEPDLIILDEFQRFKYLLDEDNEMALLARELFDYQDAKVLLLSATPYKMFTLQGEQDENHSEDFERTVKFLLDEREDDLEVFRNSLQDFRKAFFQLSWSDDWNPLRIAKSDLETVLRKVIVRTERLAASADRNGMLVENNDLASKIHADDLCGFVHLDHISSLLQTGDLVEYWKSSAYPLNLMEGYKFKRKFVDACQKDTLSQLYAHLKSAQPYLLNWDTVEAYEEIDPGNVRLRELIKDSLDSGNWKCLWLPPAFPYYQLEGAFANLKPSGYTKALIFSAWKVVPKVIATIVSYEAERRILVEKERDYSYSELTRKRKGLLTFTYSSGRLTGMPVFCLLYPSVTLAKVFDPLSISIETSIGGLTSLVYLFYKTKQKIRKLLDQAAETVNAPLSGAEDERWYWAALPLLDRIYEHSTISSWLEQEDILSRWTALVQVNSSEQSEEDSDSRFGDHVQELLKFFKDPLRYGLGKQPDDLVKVITAIAFAGPATAALRSLLRITGEFEADGALLESAVQAGMGFRTLFNQPDAVALLQSIYPDGDPSIPDEVYWQQVLKYAVQGNLQSVLDEYAHILLESLGLVGHHHADVADKISKAMRQALSIRAAPLGVDEIQLDDETERIQLIPHRLRCRYALRFGDDTEFEFKDGDRSVDVRVAFNSPFRPFILATTSVGQEGLDFHQYCHRVVHWNLPSNPVDLEQREGRVHRYKGHVIRRNLATYYGFDRLRNLDGKFNDPWRALFSYAEQDREAGKNDLEPYWVFEKGEHRIERLVPALPLSREIGHLERLKRSLVAYRSVIGQPRQQELLEFLSNRYDNEQLLELTRQCSIDLSPNSFNDGT